jgi:hypothetical protein
MFARSVLHTPEMSRARETSGGSSRRVERETGTIVISPSARQRQEKEKRARARAGKGERGKRKRERHRTLGGKEEPEEWIEDVRRPVHHLCRPTGIAASASPVRRGGLQGSGRVKEKETDRQTERWDRGDRRGTE